MEEYFYDYVSDLTKTLKQDQTLLCHYIGEQTDFVRFNKGKVRQPGTVTDTSVNLRLIQNKKTASMNVSLTGDLAYDRELGQKALRNLQSLVPDFPEDPFLLFNQEPKSTRDAADEAEFNSMTVTQDIVSGTNGLDLVGIYAGGKVERGFANSLGQKNWFSRSSFTLDWSIYAKGDRAFKMSYGGNNWDLEVFRKKMHEAEQNLPSLLAPAQSVKPGAYRVYLAPAAVCEIAELLAWGGFSMKSFRTKQSALQKLYSDENTFSEKIHIQEDLARGGCPCFDSMGFTLPKNVNLVEGGKALNLLTSPRTAKEYSLDQNSHSESPECLTIRPGKLSIDKVLDALGTGIYVSNLWYLNYSDRPQGRITGMTRFACFKVENGKLIAPINPMRFDNTVYQIFGEYLEAISEKSEKILNTMTYGHRHLGVTEVPGILLNKLDFTL